MKPSERRALEAEKRAQKEAESREKELAKQAKNQEKQRMGSRAEFSESERVNVNATYQKLPEEEIEVEGGYHKEKFFDSHVRLITFIITAALVLTVLGPWGIDMLVSIKRNDYEGKDVTDGKNMTVDELVEICDKRTLLRWSDLEGYNYTDRSYNFKDEKTKKKGTYYIRDYAVGEYLVLKVQGYSVSGAPGTVQLYLNMGTTNDVLKEVRDDDIRDFLDKYGFKYEK